MEHGDLALRWEAKPPLTHSVTFKVSVSSPGMMPPALHMSGEDQMLHAGLHLKGPFLHLLAWLTPLILLVSA